MKNQKVRNFAIVAVTAMLLAAAVASVTASQNAIAYKKNQATSQANACGNDFFPTNVGCQNTGSQIQGDENSVALAAQQTFPEERVIPPVPPIDVCPATTVWDITLDAALGDLPAGTVICLTKGLGNDKDASIANTNPPQIVEVTVAQPNVADGSCSPPFVKATATSGNPPNPVNLLDKVCVKLGSP